MSNRLQNSEHIGSIKPYGGGTTPSGYCLVMELLDPRSQYLNGIGTD